MATRKKKREVPDYPLLSLKEYEDLSPHEKVQFIAILRSRDATTGAGQLERLFDKAPEIIEKCIDVYTRHFGERTKLTRTSLWTHLAVLVVGTSAVLWLGLTKTLDGATVVAILGPLYTYVLVNLRYLTAPGAGGQNAED